MTVTINGTTGIANDGGYTGDGVVFADTTPANTLVTTTSGNVGIGTSSPSKKLDVRGASGAIHLESTTGTNAAFLEITNTGGTYYFGVENSAGTSFGCAPYAQIDWVASGRSRQVYMEGRGVVQTIDSSGNLLVGTTDSGSGATAAKQRIIGAASNNLYLGCTSAGGWRITSDALNDGGTFYHIKFSENGTQRGSITSNGSSTTYATSSDYRLKEDIQPMTGALAKVAQLKPVTYKWKADGSDGEGFIAHELAEVVPDCVTGEKDAVDAEGNPQYQGIDTSFLIATLTAAIQELKAINDAQAETITALTARVTALEGA